MFVWLTKDCLIVRQCSLELLLVFFLRSTRGMVNELAELTAAELCVGTRTKNELMPCQIDDN